MPPDFGKIVFARSFKELLFKKLKDAGLGIFKTELVQESQSITLCLSYTFSLEQVTQGKDPISVLTPLFKSLDEAPCIEMLKKEYEGKLKCKQNEIDYLKNQIDRLNEYKIYFDKAYEMMHGKPHNEYYD